jgi:hypothetical protein
MVSLMGFDLEFGLDRPEHSTFSYIARIWTAGVAQEVQCLLCQREALSSKNALPPHPPKKRI